MKLIIKLALLLFVGLSISCTEEMAVDPCEKIDEQLEGYYIVTVTHYPLQSSQEGYKEEVRVWTSLDKCRNYDISDAIYFYNLFKYYECSEKIELIDNHKFIIEYEDGHEWVSAPVKGEGTIVDEKFNFTGTVYTSAGEFPIVLDGFRFSSDIGNNICRH